VTVLNRTAPGSRIGWLMSGIGPKPVFDVPNDQGQADEAAKAAAKVIADKAAADAAAKLAADKAAADALAKTAEGQAAALQKQLADAQEALRLANEDVKKYAGIDPAKARELQKAADDAAKAALEAKGDFDRVKTMMIDEHKKALDAAKLEATTKATELLSAQQQIHNLTIGQAFGQSEFINKETVLPASKAQGVYGPHFAVENGVIVGYDKPAGTDKRTKLVDGSGNPMSFEAAMRHLVDKDPDRDKLLSSKIKAGSGSKTIDGKVTEKNIGVSGRSRIEAATAGLLKRHLKP